MSSCGSNTDACAKQHCVVNDALFHCSPRINQTLHQIIHILHFRVVDLLLNYAADFVVNWIEVMAVRWPHIIGVTTISYYCTLGVDAANDAQTVWQTYHAEKITAIRIYQN